LECKYKVLKIDKHHRSRKIFFICLSSSI